MDFRCPVLLECEKLTYLGVSTIRVSDIFDRIRYTFTLLAQVNKTITL